MLCWLLSKAVNWNFWCTVEELFPQLSAEVLQTFLCCSGACSAGGFTPLPLLWQRVCLSVPLTNDAEVMKSSGCAWKWHKIQILFSTVHQWPQNASYSGHWGSGIDNISSFWCSKLYLWTIGSVHACNSTVIRLQYMMQKTVKYKLQWSLVHSAACFACYFPCMVSLHW